MEQRMRTRNSLLATLALAVLLVAPVAADAGDAKTPERSFQKFCSGWMTKLQKREVHNAEQIRFVRKDGHVIGEYAGYAKKPARCEVKATGVPASPYIGKLVYEERVYRKTGRSPTRALSSQPKLVGATEVLEIFRFDGDDWIY
jgi:hypothetical protein